MLNLSLLLRRQKLPLLRNGYNPLTGVFISCVLYEFTLMSIHSEFVNHICEMTGDTPQVVDQDLRPAHLTLAMANVHGFKTVDEYQEAILEYVYG